MKGKSANNTRHRGCCRFFMRIKLSIIQLFTGLVFFCVVMQSAANSAGYVNGVRMWSAPDNSRIVFDTNRSIKHRLFVLHKPERVVVDFFDTRITKSLNALDITNSNIKRVRSATRNKNNVRVVFDMKVPVQPKSFTLSPNNKYGHRLVIDFFEKKKKSNKPVRSVSSSGKLKRLRDVVIAIDAGHGGEDPGALGRSGKYEKDLVLSIARRLEKKIQNQRGMRAVMVRKGDYFVSLNGRKKIARKNKADMFVSIHADSFKNSRARGASVFALSSRGASSEAARILAQNENAADVIGGVNFDESDSLLTSVLLDLTQTGTIETSLSLGGKVLKELKQVGKLHKPRVERARFVVLQSLGIPSILVETGFISNRNEERKLQSWRHQQAIANSILRGITSYFTDQSPPGTFFARRDRGKDYVIKRGDTLSVIASNSNVTMDNIKQLNSLGSDSLRIGQILRIPN